ncbi:hypothetical protein D1872_289330 [compost metagenome]
MMLGTAEAAEVQQSFRCPVKHDAHAVHEMNDPRSRFAHRFYRRLVGQKVPAID